jgi:hypothetical protein
MPTPTDRANNRQALGLPSDIYIHLYIYEFIKMGHA